MTDDEKNLDSPWVKVKDQLPIDGDKVLIASKGYKVSIFASIIFDRKLYNDGMWSGVTHWMYIPHIPED